MLVRGSPDHKAITHNTFWGILGGKTVPKLAKQMRPTQTRLAALLPSCKWMWLLIHVVFSAPGSRNSIKILIKLCWTETGTSRKNKISIVACSFSGSWGRNTINSRAVDTVGKIGICVQKGMILLTSAISVSRNNRKWKCVFGKIIFYIVFWGLILHQAL